MGLFKKRKLLSGVQQEHTDDINDHGDDERIFGSDPYYVLSGHRLTCPPPHEDLNKYWMYHQKIMLKSEWESLGFEIRDFNPTEEGYGDDIITERYSFKPLDDDAAEWMKNEYKDVLNIYEKIQRERESK